MWIIQLSTSLIGQPYLVEWLALVDRLGDGKVIIAPDDGCMVSAHPAIYQNLAKQHQTIEDEFSHRIHVLAMDQHALLLRGLYPNLVEAKTELELAERGWQHRGIIWVPSHMVHSNKELPKQTSVRATSLAAWLAHTMQAQHLVLVNDIDMAMNPVSAIDLSQQGLVDEHFDTAIQPSAHAQFSTWLLHADKHKHFNQGFDAGILAEQATTIQHSKNNPLRLVNAGEPQHDRSSRNHKARTYVFK